MAFLNFFSGDNKGKDPDIRFTPRGTNTNDVLVSLIEAKVEFAKLLALTGGSGTVFDVLKAEIDRAEDTMDYIINNGVFVEEKEGND